MQLDYNGKKTFLRFFNDPSTIPFETEISAALKRLTVPAPKIVFADGEFERSVDRKGPNDLGALVSNIEDRTTLINQGFNYQTVALRDSAVPKDASLLAIIDPRTNFTPDEVDKIQKYIASGGNLLIAGEQGRPEMINSLINPLGVQMLDGMLVQQTKDYQPNMVEALLTNTASGFSGRLKKPFLDSVGVSTPSAAGLSYSANSPFTVTPLLVTNSKNTWNKKGMIVTADSASVAYDAANGDDHKPVPVVLALTRNINGKQQRIVVAGDADFLTTAALERGRGRVRNPYFNPALFGWLTYGKFPIDVSRAAGQDNRVNLTRTGVKELRILFLYVLPGILAIYSIIFLLRRKRK